MDKMIHDDNEESVPTWAKKPLLGFSTWSTQLLDDVDGYGGKNISPWFNETNIQEISDTMKVKLPRYEYINLNSGWSNTVDGYGRWMYRSDLFPSGLGKLSKQLQRNGHKLGIYVLPGIPAAAADNNLPIKDTTHTLGEYTQQRKQGNVFRGLTYMPDVHDAVVAHYFDTMADVFADWGVGYVKIDGCGPGSGDQITPDLAPDCRATLQLMGRSFRRRGIWTELSWYLDVGYADEWAIMANGARIYIDIESYSTRTMTSASRVLDRFAFVPRWAAQRKVIGKQTGFYVDLDAVLVGMTTPWNARCIDGLGSDVIRRTYVTFWSLVSSVFCIGADPRLLPDKYVAMLHHPVVLDIHQSGRIATPLPFTDTWHYKQVWWKPLDDKVVCVGLFNTFYYPLSFQQETTSVVTGSPWLDLEVGFDLADVLLDGCQRARISDVWAGKELGVWDAWYSTRLEPGACQLLLLTPLPSS
ncbi:unnamed protein product [Absidia cylindrospora]